MITVALSATIGAPIDRVWRALTDASERPLWDERVLGQVLGETSPAREVRRDGRRKKRERDSETPILERTEWRFRLGNVPLVMHEEIVEADRPERLVCRVAMGSMHFDQTLSLRREDDESGPRTRLGMKLVARNQIAVLGEVVQRLDVQKLVIEYVDTTLRQIQKHCEAEA